jgi:hypothetical protein
MKAFGNPLDDIDNRHHVRWQPRPTEVSQNAH